MFVCLPRYGCVWSGVLDVFGLLAVKVIGGRVVGGM